MHGEIAEVVVFFPNRGGAVVEHCGKYTVRYGAWRGRHPGRRSWPCGDRAGVLVAPTGGVVVAVGGTVLQAWCGDVPRVLRARVSSWSRPEALSRVVPMPTEGSAVEKVHGVGSIVSGVVPGTSAQGIAGSHRVATVPGMAEQ